jgi:hypothetical protein
MLICPGGHVRIFTSKMQIENSLVSLEGVFLLLTLHTFFYYIIIRRKEGEDVILKQTSESKKKKKEKEK